MIFAVFRQGPPKLIPNRAEEYEAHFIYMGNVDAPNSDAAFKKARDKYCAAPVLQKGGCDA